MPEGDPDGGWRLRRVAQTARHRCALASTIARLAPPLLAGEPATRARVGAGVRALRDGARRNRAENHSNKVADACREERRILGLDSTMPALTGSCADHYAQEGPS